MPSLGKKSKLAKGRLDTFYHLAKEHGFRSRASFKLIQLNKKYGFLDNANSLVDLCAAPGGWLQVAQKQMPAGSVIIGVDLQDIRPIRDVISFTDDITKQSCIRTIQKHLKGSQVDVVLHDGAPNMGSAWTQDAYSQVDLTLKATKCATLVLKKGGWYITKVFRSEDYNSLLWVFNQLFQKVEATKPMASRNASAEIYVVCRGFLAPNKLDPRLLDSRFVFKQDDLKPKVSLTSMTKVKKNREGYDTDSVLLFKKSSVSVFLNAEDPVQCLAQHSMFEFDAETENIRDHAKTTPIIKQALNDLKVLNKNDFKILLRWRSAMRAEVLGAVDVSEKQKEKKEKEEVDKLAREQAVLSKKEKREKKRQLALKRKQVKKLQLKMVHVGDKFTEEGTLFNAESLRDVTDDVMKEISDAKLTADLELSGSEEDEIIWSDESDDGSDEETTTDKMAVDMERDYRLFLAERKKRIKNSIVEKSKLNKDEVREDHEYEATLSDDEMMNEEEDEDDNTLLKQSKKNPLLLEETFSKRNKVEAWFNTNEMFSGLDLDALGDSTAAPKRELESKKDAKPAKKLKAENGNQVVAVPQTNGKTSQTNGKGENSIKKEDKNIKQENGKVKAEPKKETKEKPKKKRRSKDDEDSKGFEVVPAEPDADSDDEDGYFNDPNFKEGILADEDSSGDETDDEEDINQKSEALAIGAKMFLRKKSGREMEDNMFSRYTFNDEELPDWFTEHEAKYIKPNIPITKQEVLEMKQRYQEINARPIKKVAEALARKRKRNTTKVTRAKEKATAIAQDESLTPGQKISQVNKIMKKANQKQGKEKVYVVSKRGGGSTGKKRKHVSHARVKLVDKRMKKEGRAHKRQEAAGKVHALKNKKLKKKAGKKGGAGGNRKGGRGGQEK